MGVDHSVQLGVGKQFGSRREVIDFIEENLTLSEEEREEIEYDLGDWKYKDSGIGAHCMDYYSGDSYFFGVQLHQGGCPLRFLKDVETSIAAWNKIFPNVNAEIVCEVEYT